MNTRQLPSALGALITPQVVDVREGVYVCWAVRWPETMKVLPAYYMITFAEATARIGRSGVIESSSGNMGDGFSATAAARELPCTLVIDDSVDAGLVARCRARGTKIERVTVGPGESSQKKRLETLRRLVREQPGLCWLSQYRSRQNPVSYGVGSTALVTKLGPVDILCVGVGTGGSSTGIAAGLRRLKPSTRLIGVDTPGSITFGAPEGRIELKGIGSTIRMPLVRHHAYDSIHWVGAREAFLAARLMLRRHGLYQGPTSAAAWWVARWYARRYPDATVAFVCPDGGARYQTTVWSDEYMKKIGAGLDHENLPEEPVRVSSPRDVHATSRWALYPWGRRSLRMVLGASSR